MILNGNKNMKILTSRSWDIIFIIVFIVLICSVGSGCTNISPASEELDDGTFEMPCASPAVQRELNTPITTTPIITESMTTPTISTVTVPPSTKSVPGSATSTIVASPDTATSSTSQPTKQPQLVEMIRELDALGGGPLALSEDNLFIATNGLSNNRDEVIYLIDVNTGDLIRNFEKPFSGLTGTSSLAFSPDGIYLAAGGYQQAIYVWNINNGELVYELPYKDNAVLSIDFSNDGKYLAAGSAGEIGGITVWNVSNGNIVDFPIPVLAADIEFMSDSSTLAVASIWYETKSLSDGAVLFWNLEEGTIDTIFSGEMATSLATSNDGDLLAAAVDGHLRLWNMSEATEIEVKSNTLSERVFRIDWSPQGSVAALNSDKSIAVWDGNGEFIINIVGLGAEDFQFVESNVIVSIFNKPLQIYRILSP